MRTVLVGKEPCWSSITFSVVQTYNLTLTLCRLKGELRSILTLSSFFVYLECCQYRQKRQKLVWTKKNSLLSSF